MDSPILTSRQDHLRRAQNSDGGWGYFSGRQSWLEPTFYAALALHGEPAAERAWKLIKSWQNPDGGWRPSAHVGGSSWVTALGVMLCSLQGDHGHGFENGVRRLLNATGAESTFLSRMIYRVFRRGVERDTSNRGWPFYRDTTAWVEPTALSVLALRKASPHFHDREIDNRIREGQQLLMTVRCRDGGWNYGNSVALGVDLPSYPETTAVALLCLDGRAAGVDPVPPGKPQSRLAEAWLRIALGSRRPFNPPAEAPLDLMIAALEAIAAPGGNQALLKLPEAGG